MLNIHMFDFQVLLYFNYIYILFIYHIIYIGNLVLNLWDCGGQYRFYESYFDSQRDTIFRNVEVLIYVFDIDSGDLENDITLFDGI